MNPKVYTIPECIREVIGAIEAMCFSARDMNAIHAQKALGLLDSLKAWAEANEEKKSDEKDNPKETEE